MGRKGWKPYHWLDVGMRDRIKLVEAELIVGADVDVCALILRLVAILGRRENYTHNQFEEPGVSRDKEPTGDAFAVVLFFISIHADLMTSDNGIQSILLAESLCDVRAELHSDTTFTRSSAWSRLRIGP